MTPSTMKDFLVERPSSGARRYCCHVLYGTHCENKEEDGRGRRGWCRRCGGPTSPCTKSYTWRLFSKQIKKLPLQPRAAASTTTPPSPALPHTSLTESRRRGSNSRYHWISGRGHRIQPRRREQDEGRGRERHGGRERERGVAAEAAPMGTVARSVTKSTRRICHRDTKNTKI